MNTLRVLLFALYFRKLRERYPSLFNGPDALEQINLAIESIAGEEQV